MVKRYQIARKLSLRRHTLLSAIKRLTSSNDLRNEAIWLSSSQITVAQVRRDKLKKLSGK